MTDPKGRDFMLYNAYHPKDFVYAGRQALLDEVKWGADEWPTINAGRGPSKQAASPFNIAERNAEHSFTDDFTGLRLAPGWHWPQANEPQATIKNGWLHLAPVADQANNPIGAVFSRTTTLGDYTATTLVDVSKLEAGALVGLAAYGNPENALGIAVGDGKVVLWQREKNQHKQVAAIDAPKSSSLHLRLAASDGSRFSFAVSSDGKDWKEVGDAEGAYLPPWDLAVRVALTAGGKPGAVGRFDWVRVAPGKP